MPEFEEAPLLQLLHTPETQVPEAHNPSEVQGQVSHILPEPVVIHEVHYP